LLVNLQSVRQPEASNNADSSLVSFLNLRLISSKFDGAKDWRPLHFSVVAVARNGFFDAILDRVVNLHLHF